MTGFLKRFLSLLAAIGTAVSCQLLSTDEQQTKEISLTPRSTALSSGEDGVRVYVKAYGKWTLDLDFGDGIEPWATISEKEGDGRTEVVLSAQANETGSPRSVVLILASEGQTATTTLTQAAGQSSSGGETSGSYGYDVAPSYIDYLELPATVAGDGRELVIHDWSGRKYTGKKGTEGRNWSCDYDASERISIWVAYPLNNNLIGSWVSRSEAWGYDPALEGRTGIQQDVSGGYKNGNNGWYSRGHQIPSADRLGTYERNSTTYYGTNMTPQNNSFNGGIWGSLEQAVRNSAASCDTLYVVTGCVLEGSNYYAVDRSNRQITVPTYYFKALLAHTLSGTYGQNGYIAAGYWLPHDGSISDKDYKNYMLSISELEKKTGLDFFPNLIGKIGVDKSKLVETQLNTSWWK